jgi:hypothetical protein
MTILYFLNDVEEGGETAFPLADNATADSAVRTIIYDICQCKITINISMAQLYMWI